MTFAAVTVTRDIPERTRDSVTCATCGEDVNTLKVRKAGENSLCIPCAKTLQ